MFEPEPENKPGRETRSRDRVEPEQPEGARNRPRKPSKDVQGGRRGACESQELARRRCQIWGFSRACEGGGAEPGGPGRLDGPEVGLKWAWGET
jgi:hypothetical protein